MDNQKKLLLFKAIVGSQAYGTNTPESDTDIKGIYIQDPFDVGSFMYEPQDIPDKDTTYWEIRRFLELAMSSNPTVLELLFSPEDCILYEHELFKRIRDNRDLFLTKECKNSFMGYAKQQIYKAKGLNKKMNWESERIERKLPIDFCKVIYGTTGIEKLSDWLKRWNINPLTGIGDHERRAFITKIDNTKQLYKLYFTYINDYSKPFCNEDDLLLTAIPEDIYPQTIGLIQYDLDGFQAHCREYNQYQTWLKERNEARYVDVKNHGQKIDGKNMLHCIRLIEMAKDVAEGKGLIIRRPNAQELLKIRKGELDLQEIIDKTDQLIVDVEDAFNKSSLPDKIDHDLVNELLVNIRKQSLNYFYGENTSTSFR